MVVKDQFPDLPRCYAKTEFKDLTLIGIYHLTRRWTTSEDRERTKSLLEADLPH
jgi:hypothetical protein